MTDPIADIIGDYQAFAAQQRDRLLALGIGHVDDWMPQRLVTATGPNPLSR